MKYFDNIAQAADETRTWIILNGEDLPPVTTELAKTGVSPVDLVVKFAEIVYTNQDSPSYTEEAKDIAAANAVLAEQYGFHGLNVDGRGTKIASVLLGNTVENPPEPKQEYA